MNPDPRQQLFRDDRLCHIVDTAAEANRLARLKQPLLRRKRAERSKRNGAAR
jgi:hypothetical protein